MKMSKIKKYIYICLCMLLFTIFLYGCGEKSDTNADDVEKSESSGDPYEDYIHQALEAVRDSAQVADSASDTTSPDSNESEVPSNGRVIQIERGEEKDAPEPVFVSSEVADDSTDTSDSKDDSDEKKTTPETFEVGTGLVYIDGKYDDAYRTNLLKTINDERAGLNYPEMTVNTSLNTCANLRAKEITSYLSHVRPDGSMFYSLAPDYYKAEIITVDSANPKETFDAWMTDPISRGILLSKEYTSIGASNYICNGLNCIVVSFGY